MPLRRRALLDPGLGMERWPSPAEALDYFVSPTPYDTAHAQEDLEGTGSSARASASYADRLLDFMAAHPEFGSEAMV